MKKNISYWNAIFTHLLTTGFMAGFLTFGVALLVTKVLAGLIASDSALVGMLPFVSIILIAGVVALATWLSARYLSRYEISGVENFVNFSSIIFCVIALLRFGFLPAAVCTIVFYTITKKKFPHVAVAPVAPVSK